MKLNIGEKKVKLNNSIAFTPEILLLSKLNSKQSVGGVKLLNADPLLFFYFNKFPALLTYFEILYSSFPSCNFNKADYDEQDIELLTKAGFIQDSNIGFELNLQGYRVPFYYFEFFPKILKTKTKFIDKNIRKFHNPKDVINASTYFLGLRLLTVNLFGFGYSLGVKNIEKALRYFKIERGC